MKFVKTWARKISRIGMCSLLLAGCGSYAADRLETDTEEQIKKVLADPVLRPVYTHHFYDYYALPAIGRIDSTRTGNIFSLDGTRFIMNLHINTVLCDTYYQAESADTSLEDILPEMETSGTYVDYHGDSYSYTVAVYLMGTRYYTLVTAGAMDFAAISDACQVPYLAGEMIRLARSVRLHKSEILSAFSNRQAVISGSRKRVDLFHDLAPESGAIEELFDHTNMQGDQPADTIGSGTTEGEGGDPLEAN